MPDTAPVSTNDLQAFHASNQFSDEMRNHSRFGELQTFASNTANHTDAGLAQYNAMLAEIQGAAGAQQQAMVPVDSARPGIEATYAELEVRKREAEEYLTKKLHEEVIVPAFSKDGKPMPLPEDTKVELLTGENNGVRDLEIKVTSQHMSVVGEKEMGDAVLKILSTVPALAEKFEFGPKPEGEAQTEGGKPRPTDFSWTEDRKSMGVKFNGQDAATVANQLIDMKNDVVQPVEQSTVVSTEPTATSTATANPQIVVNCGDTKVDVNNEVKTVVDNAPEVKATGGDALAAPVTATETIAAIAQEGPTNPAANILSIRKTGPATERVGTGATRAEAEAASGRTA